MVVLTVRCFQACGPYCESLVLPCIKSLGELRDSAQYSLTSELDNAVSKAVRAMGPKAVMKAIPLEVRRKVVAIHKLLQIKGDLNARKPT